MMTPRFYIFGTPEGFDMLDGTLQDVSYFQRFYDGSKENTKFSIHRTAQGSVSYVFLKYSLSSCNSRTGAFFGMALVFDNEFCAAPLRLYKLFDYVYQEHILYHDDSNKGFLKAIIGSEIKAQFLISRFEDQQNQIKFIEKVLLVNLQKDDILSSAFYPLGPGFKNENQNMLVKLAMDGASDEKIVNKCRNYNYVTISPDWIKGPEESEISPHVVMHWKDLTSEYRRFIIFGLGNLNSVDKTEVKKYQNQTGGILSQLRNNRYNKNIAPNLESDYEEINEQLADLYQKAADAQSDDGGDTNPPPPPDSIPPTPQPIPSFWNSVKEWVIENKGKVASIIGTAAVLMLLLVLIFPKLKWTGDHKHNHQYCCTERVNQVIDSVIIYGFKEAWHIADTVSDDTLKRQKKKLIIEKILKFNNDLNQEIADHKKKNQWVSAFNKTNDYIDIDTVANNVGEKIKNTELERQLREDYKKYFSKEIDELSSNYSTMKANQLKEELEAVKDYIGDQYNSLKDKISNIKPPGKPKPKTTYKIEYLKVDDRGKYHDLKKNINRDKDGIRTITSYEEIIDMNGSYAIIFCVVNQNNNEALPLTSDDIICNGATIDTNNINSGWIGVNSIENDATITINIANITITLKKEQ